MASALKVRNGVCIIKLDIFLKIITIYNHHKAHQWEWNKGIQSSAVITRSKIVRYCINNCRNWGRISIRIWIHKRRPITRPDGRAMGCLLLIFLRKIDRVIMAPHCILIGAWLELCCVKHHHILIIVMIRPVCGNMAAVCVTLLHS